MLPFDRCSAPPDTVLMLSSSYVDDVFSIIPKGNWDKMLHYLNSIGPHIKFTLEQPNEEGASPSWTPSPNPKEEVLLLQYTGNLHTWTSTLTSIPVTLSQPKELW